MRSYFLILVLFSSCSISKNIEKKDILGSWKLLEIIDNEIWLERCRLEDKNRVFNFQINGRVVFSSKERKLDKEVKEILKSQKLNCSSGYYIDNKSYAIFKREGKWILNKNLEISYFIKGEKVIKKFQIKYLTTGNLDLKEVESNELALRF